MKSYKLAFDFYFEKVWDMFRIQSFWKVCRNVIVMYPISSSSIHIYEKYRYIDRKVWGQWCIYNYTTWSIRLDTAPINDSILHYLCIRLSLLQIIWYKYMNDTAVDFLHEIVVLIFYTSFISRPTKSLESRSTCHYSITF